MGGGDLNLKKSWHPSTLRNIERVWKAEQKHEVEKQKIEQLQKELAEERAREEIQAYAEEKGVVKKKEEKLDWMYQGPAAMVNRDDYLLGRKIDKSLEMLQQQESGVESKKDDSPGSDLVQLHLSFHNNHPMSCHLVQKNCNSLQSQKVLILVVPCISSQDLTGTATVDLANKIREDPLFCIMKKEKEQRKNLLTNPVKMKQLQQLLQASLGKKNKKHKKDKKKKHASSESDDEKPVKKSKETHKSSNSKDQNTYDRYYEPEKNFSDRKYSKTCSSSNTKYEGKQSSRESYKTSNDFYKDSHKSTRHQSSQNRAYDSEDERHKSRSHHSRKREADSVRDHRSSKYEYHEREDNYSKKSSSYHKKDDYDARGTSKKKLDSAERERLLQEMQDNAKWRDEQRKRNTQRYRAEDEMEDKYERLDTSDFLKPVLAKVAGKGSLENRVKQKIFSIQRSSSDMDKNFARR
ncbi:pre-mRNA-splicing factor CWC25 homolog [Uloborus diversus]|uniref:pre-mRNA-splicing factor CWC25 homolog n=1 Tax=Uloborus diversus TaxID=327109 RepID=UPI002409A4CC|nr:pre-mRNA-splicing factor CWC25 homolog [Uloborus diversus]